MHLQLFKFLNFVIKVTSEIKTMTKISANTVVIVVVIISIGEFKVHLFIVVIVFCFLFKTLSATICYICVLSADLNVEMV